MYYYEHQGYGDDRLLRMRMNEIAKIRVRYGFRRILILLRREGFKDNHKRSALFVIFSPSILQHNTNIDTPIVRTAFG